MTPSLVLRQLEPVAHPRQWRYGDAITATQKKRADRYQRSCPQVCGGFCEKTCEPMVPAMQAARYGGGRQRWSGSSRRHPCPLCGRAHNDQCRRGPDFLSCWKGSSHHPPDLRLGEVVTIEGEPWAVVSTAGGYGSNSIVLKPHISRSAFSRSPVVRRKIRAAVAPELRRQLARIRRQYHAVVAARDPYWLAPEQLRRDRAIAAACLASLQGFLRQLHRHRRDVPEAGDLVPTVLLWLRETAWQLADPFDRVMLGTPTADEIEALRQRQEVAA